MRGIRAPAEHPHWKGYLRFDDEGTVVHEETSSRGKYRLEEERLLIQWEAFPEEQFVNVCERWVQSSLITDFSMLHKMRYIRALNDVYELRRISLYEPLSKAEFIIRANSSDCDVFKQVFVDREYVNDALPGFAEYIVDLGANVGLSTAFFATRYPQAHIVAVEPDGDNFELLRANTAQFGVRVSVQQAAIWHKDGSVRLEARDASGARVESWAVQVRDDNGSHQYEDQARVESLSMQSLLKRHGYPRIDILKVDIEGAELELFGHALDWLESVQLLIIETHDRFRPGSDDSVRRALRHQFSHIATEGENLIFRRNDIAAKMGR